MPYTYNDRNSSSGNPAVANLAETLAFPKVRGMQQQRPERTIGERQLALFTGSPAFPTPLHVGRPNMPSKADYLARIDTMLDSGWLSNGGPMVREFEALVAEVSDAKHCVATCNGTLALELAIAALGLSGEVIVPSFTFVATVHSLTRQGITPVFCDIDSTTHCLDIDSVAQAITPQTTGILAVTLWGNPCNEVALRRLADANGLGLIFDSAHSFGCDLGRGRGERLCDLEIYSFHATKCIQALEGGAIITDDDDLAKRVRQMSNFGFVSEDKVEMLGTNAKMNEAAAAMGLCSIEQRERLFSHNRRNHEAYQSGVAALAGVSLGVEPIGKRHNYQYVVLDFDEELAGLSRSQFIAALRSENILARRYFYPGVHRMAPYSGWASAADVNLPVTEKVAGRVIIMPSGMSISSQDVYKICETMGAILTHASEVASQLSDNDPRLPPKL